MKRIRAASVALTATLLLAGCAVAVDSVGQALGHAFASAAVGGVVAAGVETTLKDCPAKAGDASAPRCASATTAPEAHTPNTP